MGNKHVTSRPDGRWAVRESGAERASKVFDTQKEAVKFARTSAKNEGTEIYVHQRDGRIIGRESYGRDPNPPKGSRK